MGVDVYSFAMVAFEMVSNEIPFRGMSSVQISHAVANEDLRPVIPRSCPPKAKEIIQRCWSGDHSKRPSFSSIMKYLDQGVKTGSFWGNQEPKVMDEGPTLAQKLAQCANLLEGPGSAGEYADYGEEEQVLVKREDHQVEEDAAPKAPTMNEMQEMVEKERHSKDGREISGQIREQDGNKPSGDGHESLPDDAEDKLGEYLVEIDSFFAGVD